MVDLDSKEAGPIVKERGYVLDETSFVVLSEQLLIVVEQEFWFCNSERREW
jgi:hypothetical protein